MDRILDKDKVLRIFQMRMNGTSLRGIAAEMNISRQHALNVLMRRAYKDVDVHIAFVRAAKNHTNVVRLKAKARSARIVARHNAGYTQKEIAEIIGCGVATVCRTLQKHKS